MLALHADAAHEVRRHRPCSVFMFRQPRAKGRLLPPHEVASSAASCAPLPRSEAPAGMVMGRKKEKAGRRSTEAETACYPHVSCKKHC